MRNARCQASPVQGQKGDERAGRVNPAIPHDQVSGHARVRMSQRGISIHEIFLVIAFGRISRGRGATIYVVGKKEIASCAADDIDLSSCEGIHVVMNGDGVVSTVYRNHSLPKMKPRRRIPERIFRENRKRRKSAEKSFLVLGSL